MVGQMQIPKKSVLEKQKIVKKGKSKKSVTRNQSRYIRKFETSMNLGSGISIVDQTTSP